MAGVSKESIETFNVPKGSFGQTTVPKASLGALNAPEASFGSPEHRGDLSEAQVGTAAQQPIHRIETAEPGCCYSVLLVLARMSASRA